MWKVLVGLFLDLCLVQEALAGPFDDAISAYRAGDFPTALKLLIPLARQGDPSAENDLGVIYERGQGTPQDYGEAVKWYRMAAEQGDVTAEHNLAVMYA